MFALLRRVTLMITLATLLFACAIDGDGDGGGGGQPIDSKTAALSATTNVQDALEGLDRALQFLEEAQIVARLGEVVGGGGMVCETSEIATPGEEPPAPPPEPECYEEDFEVEISLDEVAEDAVEWLNEAVFVDAQIESEADGAVVYLLDPAVFCAELEGREGEGGAKAPRDRPETRDPEKGPPDPYAGEGEEGGPAAECEELLTKVPVRVRFSSPASGDVDVDVLFGEARLDPVDIALYSAQVALTVDLAATRAVVELIDAAYAEEGEPASDDLPETMTGALRFELVKTADGAYTAAARVVEAITVAGGEGDEAFSVSLGNSSVLVGVTQADAELMWVVTVGAISAEFPYAAFVEAMEEDEEEDWDGEGAPVPPYEEEPAEEPAEPEGSMSVALAGLTATGALTGADDLIQLTGLGIGDGPFQLMKDGASLLEIVLNADAGGQFDLAMGVAEDNLVVALTPSLDLSAVFAMASLADTMEDLPSFTLDETLHLRLDGAEEPEVELVEGAEDADGSLRVNLGALLIESSAAPDKTITVPEGGCLFVSDDDDEEREEPVDDPDGHELLDSLQAGSCPAL